MQNAKIPPKNIPTYFLFRRIVVSEKIDMSKDAMRGSGALGAGAGRGVLREKN